MQRNYLNNTILTSLIVVTFIVILLQEFSFNKTVSITGDTEFSVSNVNDSGDNGGKSESSLKAENGQFILLCKIVASDFLWPFCEITITLFNSEDIQQQYGIDLSTYDTVNISAKYENHKNASIRFQIRSFNEKYSSLTDQNTWKYNGLEYQPKNTQYPANIPMNSLQVSTWWLIENQIPIELSAPEFEHAMVIEIATGNGISPGEYKLIIEKIEFLGKRFNTRKLYITIIVIWLLFATSVLFIQLSRSKRKLIRAERRTHELKQLNKLLNVESKVLKDQAERDPLTGALNRSGIQAIFTEELKVLSLMFVDIDHFKKVNDEYGHTIGDEILKIFAKLLSENSRTTDFLARWGGEEFLLVCPNTDLFSTADLAEDIREIIESSKWPKGIRLTASFGIAQRDNESPTAFIDRADKALYAAKARGRNLVVASKNSRNTKN